MTIPPLTKPPGPPSEEAAAQAAAFRNWLHDHGYTYYSFAKRCRIDQRRVQDWAKGRRACPILLPAVLELLETLEVLMNREEKFDK